jgi:CRISPR-associated endoribonuclease Cas6
MPFSLVLQGYPTTDVPVAHVQGPILQAMFLELIRQVDPALSQRLHDEHDYRPYTLSPLGIVAQNRDFQGYWLPRERLIRAETLCYVRITFLDDSLFAAFSSYFLSRIEPTVRLGDTQFVVTDVLVGADSQQRWGRFVSYQELVQQASATERRIHLRFLTPTSFRAGDLDVPLPLPRLVFRSFQKRFAEFAAITVPPELPEQVEQMVGVSRLTRVNTRLIKTKRVMLCGFTGDVTFEIAASAPSELVGYLNLLADYAFFCGTGRKTTVGMGQTKRLYHSRGRR